MRTIKAVMMPHILKKKVLDIHASLWRNTPLPAFLLESFILLFQRTDSLSEVPYPNPNRGQQFRHASGRCPLIPLLILSLIIFILELMIIQDNSLSYVYIKGNVYF